MLSLVILRQLVLVLATALQTTADYYDVMKTQWICITRLNLLVIEGDSATMWQSDYEDGMKTQTHLTEMNVTGHQKWCHFYTKECD